MEKNVISAERVQEKEYRPFPNVEGRNSRQENMEVPVVIKLLGVRRGLRILEVGCGQGIALPPLFERCTPARIVGIDIDEKLAAKARKRLRDRAIEGEIVHGDVRDMPFPDKSFDLVIDFGTCYHIARTEDALREISRVLDANGEFIYETPLSQFLSHPIRSFGRRIPWQKCPEFRRVRNRVLWQKAVIR